MAVSGIYDHVPNGYGVRQTQTPYGGDLNRAGADKRGEQPDALRQSADLASSELVREKSAGRTANLEQVSLKFNREESFEYIGTDSSLASLDMQRAISDMQKDQVLRNYQYFVGNAAEIFDQTVSGDGTVMLKS